MSLLNSLRCSMRLRQLACLLVCFVFSSCQSENARTQQRKAPNENNADFQANSAEQKLNLSQARHGEVNQLASDFVAKSDIVFNDITESTGISFSYHNGFEGEQYSILESLGGGCALCDFNLDHRLDLIVSGGGRITQEQVSGLETGLFQQQSDMQFIDVGKVAGVTLPKAYSHGISTCDFNEDGFSDFLLTGYGGLTLYENLGDGTFSEVSATAKLGDNQWSSSAAFGDFNSDGCSDLFVAHYVNWSLENNPHCFETAQNRRDICSPKQFLGLQDVLYLSNCQGQYSDVSESSGITKPGKGLSVVVADVNEDQQLDVYVTNDTVDNFLYINNGMGQFQENGMASGTAFSDQATPDGSMGSAIADYNSDGKFDIWVTNYQAESIALYRNDGHGLFQHSSRRLGVTAVGSRYVGWGTVFLDADCDGDEDVFVSNGHVILYPKNGNVAQPPLMFENETGTRFHDISAVSGEYFDKEHHGRGVTAGDIDRDGDPDLVISHVNQPLTVLANEKKNQSASLNVHLVGTESTRIPIGAVVILRSSQGDQFRQLQAGGSYASSLSPILHFGLKLQSQIDAIEVNWPSGTRQVFDSISTNSTVTIVEGFQEIFYE